MGPFLRYRNYIAECVRPHPIVRTGEALRVAELTPEILGRKLARTVYDLDGRVLLMNGVRIAERHLDALARRGIARVLVEDELAPGLGPADPIDGEMRLRLLRTVKEAADGASRGERVKLDRLDAAVDDLLHALRAKRGQVFSLLADRLLEDPHLEHSVNVCILALILGDARGLSPDDLHKLGMGAILHDVGKLTPFTLAGKEDLSPSQLLRLHPEVGYDFLRGTFNLGVLSCHVAFQHHEFLDGSGYPRGLDGGRIHEFGLVAAVANTYENLVAGAAGRSYNPEKLFGRLKAMAGVQLDAGLVEAILARVSPFAPGTIVALTGGAVGVVTGPSGDAARPRVRLLTDRDRNLIAPVDVDLSARPDLAVAAVLPEYPPEVLEQAAGSATASCAD